MAYGGTSRDEDSEGIDNDSEDTERQSLGFEHEWLPLPDTSSHDEDDDGNDSAEKIDISK